jgi:hypothetical protein
MLKSSLTQNGQLALDASQKVTYKSNLTLFESSLVQAPAGPEEMYQIGVRDPVSEMDAYKRMLEAIDDDGVPLFAAGELVEINKIKFGFSFRSRQKSAPACLRKSELGKSKADQLEDDDDGEQDGDEDQDVDAGCDFDDSDSSDLDDSDEPTSSSLSSARSSAATRARGRPRGRPRLGGSISSRVLSVDDSEGTTSRAASGSGRGWGRGRGRGAGTGRGAEAPETETEVVAVAAAEEAEERHLTLSACARKKVTKRTRPLMTTTWKCPPVRTRKMTAIFLMNDFRSLHHNLIIAAF